MRNKKTSRTEEKKLKDRAVIADRYLKGDQQYDIAIDLGMSPSQVCNDLIIIRKQWLDSSLQDFNELKAKELRKLDELESEAWKAWKASKKNKATETIETMTIRKGKEAIPSKTVSKKEGQTGNPKYMAIIITCIQQRCNIIGLEAPKVLKVEDIDDVIEAEFKKGRGSE